jgi:hypothetical protein
MTTAKAKNSQPTVSISALRAGLLASGKYKHVRACSLQWSQRSEFGTMQGMNAGSFAIFAAISRGSVQKLLARLARHPNTQISWPSSFDWLRSGLVHVC